MAAIPLVGTYWRCKDTGEVVEVESVHAPSNWGLNEWAVHARVIVPGPACNYSHVIARAHHFCTEGYEHVEPVSAP